MSRHTSSVTRRMHNLWQRSRSSSKPARPLLLICLLLVLPLLYQIKPAHSEFTTIQAAVDNATAGDIIYVPQGIYSEHVVVTKSLAIIGENPETTIVDGTANGSVFDIDASNVNITGFTIRNAGSSYSGIASTRDISTVDYHHISNNIITANGYGIYLGRSERNTIFNNTFISNDFSSIFLSKADETNITANTIVDSAYGIQAVTCLGNSIIGNTISQTSFAIHLTSSSTGNTISSNLIYGQTAGVYTSSDSTAIEHNTFIGGAYGIYLYSCFSASVYYNIISNSSYGIRIYNPASAASSHYIDNNRISDTDWALELINAGSNTFRGNWIQRNTYGMYMQVSGSNTIYHNNFVSNAMQAYCLGTGNLWDYGGEGNYWSDYEGEDADHNGIGDTAYLITPVGSDNFPLMTTWSEHDVSIENATFSTIVAYQGATVDIVVTVENHANTTVSETFDVTAKYDLNIIDVKTVVNLAQGAAEILTFSWNTTGVALGSYTISAEASIVPDELNIDNNIFRSGTLTIRLPGDTDGDGDVDYDDLALVAGAYGSSVGQPAFKEEADFNHDGHIDYDDLTVLAGAYGTSA